MKKICLLSVVGFLPLIASEIPVSFLAVTRDRSESEESASSPQNVSSDEQSNSSDKEAEASAPVVKLLAVVYESLFGNSDYQDAALAVVNDLAFEDPLNIKAALDKARAHDEQRAAQSAARKKERARKKEGKKTKKQQKKEKQE